MTDPRPQQRAAAADRVTASTASGGGPAGSAANTGQTSVNFGNPPGGNYAEQAVSAPTITNTSVITAWIRADSTVDHNAQEHMIAPIRITVSAPSPGVGFTIYALSDWRLTGSFNVRWSWS